MPHGHEDINRDHHVLTSNGTMVVYNSDISDIAKSLGSYRFTTLWHNIEDY